MSESTGKPSREQLSKTPSWIMLGFVLGCIFALTIKHELESRDEAATAAAPSPPPAHPRPESPTNTLTVLKDRPSLAAIEDIFKEYGTAAVWDADLTEIAVLNGATNRYTDFFEVQRYEGNYYFRSIPKLTRPVIAPEPNQQPALLFTGHIVSYQPLSTPSLVAPPASAPSR